jgi:hypothetical protein
MGVIDRCSVTRMVRIHVYLKADELEALHHAARRSWGSVSDLVRDAIRRTWMRPSAPGPVALWDGTPSRTSVEHGATYDTGREDRRVSLIG